MAKTECSSCGHQNDLGAQFCASCGASTELQAHCPSCNSLQRVGESFCTRCGQAMAGAQWNSGPADGGVIDGVWQRSPEEFIRRVDPDDMRSILGNKTLQVPPGTIGVVLVNGVVDRVMPPGQRTSLNIFERIANFLTRRDERTAFFLIDLRPIPIPFVVQTRPSGDGRTVQTQVMASLSLQRGNKEGIAAFIANVLGTRAAFAAVDLYNLLRPDVTSACQRVLERLAADGELNYADAEAALRRELAERLAARYGLGVDVNLAPLTRTATLSFHLGTGTAPNLITCGGCDAEVPATMQFCDRCGTTLPVSMSPDRRCTGCSERVHESDPFCSGCGKEYVAPPATATPLFTADGHQLEVDVVVRVQGQHDDFSPSSISEALVGAISAQLRAGTLTVLASNEGFAAVEQALKPVLVESLAAYGLQLVAVNLLDLRSKTGQWLLGARADLNRAREQVTLGRDWLEQRTDEIDLEALTYAQELNRQRVQRLAKLRELQLELGVDQREQALRIDDQLATDAAALEDRDKRQQLADDSAKLDVSDAQRSADRDQAVAAAQRSVADDQRAYDQQTELGTLDHDMDKETRAAAHERDLTRSAMALESDGKRLTADDKAYAERAQAGVEHDNADREQQRQLDKLQAMADLDQSMADQEHQHILAKREALKGLSESEIIAMQANELAKSENGGAAWAEVLAARSSNEAAEQRLADLERHASQVKDLMQSQAKQMQAMTKDQLDRMQDMTNRVLEGGLGSHRDVAAAGVYESSMDAMSRVAASRAQAAPVVATHQAAELTTPCTSCGASLRSGAQFCGACGQQQ